MASLWQSANELLDALHVYERQCLFYEPKDPRRDAQYREAAHAYAAAAAAFLDWKRSYLTTAVSAHAEAEAEERLL